MTVNVEQAGKQITLSGNVQLMGQSVTFAAIIGAINNTGFSTLTGGGYSGSLDDPDCGEVTGLSESINFFENESLEFVENYVYQLCGSASLRAVLHRSWRQSKNAVGKSRNAANLAPDSMLHHPQAFAACQCLCTTSPPAGSRRF